MLQLDDASTVTAKAQSELQLDFSQSLSSDDGNAQVIRAENRRLGFESFIFEVYSCSRDDLHTHRPPR